VRLAPDQDSGPSGDDLVALADAVREAARPVPNGPGAMEAEPLGRAVEVGRRGHLRALRSTDG
jgi:hypothetical protein